jgi:hypothetical protein
VSGDASGDASESCFSLRKAPASLLYVSLPLPCLTAWPSDHATKYGWIYIKQTQNDNLTSDPPSALLRAGA